MKSPGVTFRFGGFQDSVDRFVIGGHNLYRYEVFAGFQQNVLVRLNTVILSGIRFNDVDIDGLVQHIDEGAPISFLADGKISIPSPAKSPAAGS